MLQRALNNNWRRQLEYIKLMIQANAADNQRQHSPDIGTELDLSSRVSSNVFGVSNDEGARTGYADEASGS